MNGIINKLDYQYNLPKHLIAGKPVSPRDMSRLLVYDTKTDTVTLDRFINIDQYLPKNSLMVLNNTKVLPSRIVLHKQTPSFNPLSGTTAGKGGKVTVLFLVNEFVHSPSSRSVGLRRDSQLSTIRGMIDRKVRIGERLYFSQTHYCTAVSQNEHLFTFKLGFPREELFSLLQHKGTMPIPLYIKNSPLSEHELRHKYQTIFARVPAGTRFYLGSCAAPTASLHFTNRVFKKIEKKGVKKCFVTLHVGLGTFAPITGENIRSKKLHEEYFEIPHNTFHLFNQLKSEGRGITAVGTTVVRTLESFANSKIPSTSVYSEPAELLRVSKTDLFIYPPYEFKMVDHLITNFHLPGSSLMMLVEAFLEHKNAKRHLVDLYQIAIKHNFRFYSFGDAMVIT